MAHVDRSSIRVKAMLVALDDDALTHAVSVHAPTAENPAGFHRLVGGSVEPGERHRDAVVREVAEELGARIIEPRLMTVLENIFTIDGTLGHEVVFLHAGRLTPPPSRRGATLTEDDGAVVPVVWRPVDDAAEPLPLYPHGASDWVRAMAEGRA